jgi:hypothetical protein
LSFFDSLSQPIRPTHPIRQEGEAPHQEEVEAAAAVVVEAAVAEEEEVTLLMRHTPRAPYGGMLVPLA